MRATIHTDAMTDGDGWHNPSDVRRLLPHWAEKYTVIIFSSQYLNEPPTNCRVLPAWWDWLPRT